MTHGASACAGFVLGGMLVATLAACGGAATAPNPPAGAQPPAAAPAAGTPAASAAAQGQGTATVTGTVTLSGTYIGASLNGSGTYTETVHSASTGGNACADFAQKGDIHGTGFSLTPPPVTIAGHAIAITVSPFSTYTGPGDYRYTGGDSRLPTGSLVDVVLDNALADYGDPGTGTADLLVGADGSGKVTFAGLKEMNDNGDISSGSVTWTCG